MPTVPPLLYREGVKDQALGGCIARWAAARRSPIGRTSRLPYGASEQNHLWLHLTQPRLGGFDIGSNVISVATRDVRWPLCINIKLYFNIHWV